MNNILIGKTAISNNLLAINRPATPGVDSGIIIDRNLDDINDFQITGVVVSATLTSVQINEIIDIGYMIMIGGIRRRVNSVTGNTVHTDIWPSIPSGTYFLSKNTHIAIVHKNDVNRVIIGYTHNDSTVNIVDIAQSASQSAYFNIIDNININQTVFNTSATFIWVNSEYSIFSQGKLIFYVNGNIDIRLRNEGTLVDYLNANYTTGFYSININNPTADSIINIELRGTGLLRGMVLKF